MSKQLHLNEQGFIVKAGQRQLTIVKRELPPITLMSDEEFLSLPYGEAFTFDVETFPNFWCVVFKHLSSGKFLIFERSPGADFNPTQLKFALMRCQLIGFNSNNYDIPIIEYAVSGADNTQLKQASDFIIQGKVSAYIFRQTYGLPYQEYNHIDLFHVCPVNGNLTGNPASLKTYAGRLHAHRMQDLPFPPDYLLSQSDAEIVRAYCCNDLSNTELLFKALSNELQLRTEMSASYGIELRSRSDAQIAEAIITKQLTDLLGYRPKKPKLPTEGSALPVLRYNAPDFICFQTPQLQRMFENVKSAEFELDPRNGSPIAPESFHNLNIKLGKSIYSVKLGGLHSCEKSTTHVADADTIIADNDVESFYPRTILNQGLYPEHLGEAFLTVYERIVQTRIQAKAAAKAGDKSAQVVADSLKITINGSFGKLGNQHSVLYAPQLMLQVTITGQLVLLMLIEALELVGIECISGNTDGVISKYPAHRHQEVRALIEAWERYTGYKTEETRYKAVYSKDVNNYVAVKHESEAKPTSKFLDEQLGCKTKGAYSERGSAQNSPLSKNPEALICVDAMLQYLVNGKSVESTIRSCQDFSRFLTVRNVRGGGEKGGIYLGKVVRWYYAKNEAGYIATAEKGNKVANTDGGKPVMDLPSVMPTDIDYDWYIREAVSMLYDCGRLKRPTTGLLPF